MLHPNTRFEEEEKMRKYLQGQRRQGLDKVKWKLNCCVVPYILLWT